MQKQKMCNNYHMTERIHPRPKTSLLITHLSVSFFSVYKFTLALVLFFKLRWLIQIDIQSERRTNTHYATNNIWWSIPTSQDVLLDNSSISFGSVYKFTLAGPAWHFWTEKTQINSCSKKEYATIITRWSVPTSQDVLVDNSSVSFGSV